MLLFLNILHTFSPFILTIFPGQHYYYYNSHFIDEETEAWSA